MADIPLTNFVRPLIKSIQHGRNACVSGNYDITINAVDVNNSFLMFSITDQRITINLLNSTTVRITATVAGTYVDWYVVEFY